MNRYRILSGIFILLFIFFSGVVISGAFASERRPIEGFWDIPDTAFVDTSVRPLEYYCLKGERLPITFKVSQEDAALFASCDVQPLFPKELQPVADDMLVTGSDTGRGFFLQPMQIGRYPLSMMIVNQAAGFELSYDIELVVIDDLDSLPVWTKPHMQDIVYDASPPPIDASGTMPKNQTRAPANYAHVYGLAASYDYPSDDRRLMLRGVRLELWEAGGALLATVHSSDATGEGNYGLDVQDYITTSTNTYHHVSDSGTFDFGNIYVGPSGKTLHIKVFFRFYSTADGTSTAGNQRMIVYDGENGNNEVTYTWNAGLASSGQEKWVGLYGSLALSSSNGTVADEAMHNQIDMSRQYRFFRDCTGYEIPNIPVYLYLSNTGAPSSSGSQMNMRGWDNGYLTYHYTDSIRHEYTHCMHYQMRSGSFPPWGPGDENHGNCSNATSSDAWAEGFARWVPTLLFRDALYHWTASSTQIMFGTSNYCTAPTPDDRHEWAAGRALWRAWDQTGQSNSYANCFTDSIRTRDPDYVEDTFNGVITDCSYDHQIWVGFNDHGINYDHTAPTYPTGMSHSPAGRWINDNTPTWTWTASTDNISGVDGYGIYLGSSASMPDATKDIEEVSSYTPSAMSDGSNYYLNLRPVDYAGNWVASYVYDGPVGIDTVIPGPASNLHSTTHTTGQWSNNPNVTMAWTTASDDRSGLDGYGIYWSYSSALIPGATKDIEGVTSYSEMLTQNSSARYFSLRSVDNAGNWDDGYVSSGPYYIDTESPGTATNLQSTSHYTYTWSNDTTIDFTWTAAPDNAAGIDGYGEFLSGDAAGAPGATKDMEQVTSFTKTAPTSSSGQYFKLRAVDNAGNWQTDFAVSGAYYIDAITPNAPSGLSSTTHAIGGCTTDDSYFSVSWTAATDAHSGLYGYSYAFSVGGTATPDTVRDLTAGVTSMTDVNIGYSTNSRYFNIHARDNAGNWSTVASYGPFYSDRGPQIVNNVAAAKPAPSSSQVNLSWPSTSAYYYRVERSTTPIFSSYTLYTTTSTSYLDSPPVASILYYRVRSVNRCGVVGS